MHLVGFIVSIYHDARSPEHQKLALGLFWGEKSIVIIQYGKTENATQSRRDTQNPVKKSALQSQDSFDFSFETAVFLLPRASSMVTLSEIKRSSAETSRNSCDAQERDKRSTL